MDLMFDSLQDREKRITESLKANPLVAVFKAETHGTGKPADLRKDAETKVAAMYAGGVRTFEFLLRGDTKMALDTDSPLGKLKGITDPGQTYIGQMMDIIRDLAAAYPQAKFGVGTISSPEVMRKVVRNDAISFCMTAHYPGAEDGSIVSLAVKAKKPILTTASRLTDVPMKIYSKGDNEGFAFNGKDVLGADTSAKFAASGEGETIEFSPKDKGKDELDPQALSEIRAAGSGLFKASDFTEMAKTRASKADAVNARRSGAAMLNGLVIPDHGWRAQVDAKEPDPLTKVALGLIVIAEAVQQSYALEGKTLPPGKSFTVATTGGVDQGTLPYLAVGIHDPKVAQRITEIVGQADAEKLFQVLRKTTLGAGGTFMTKEFDAAMDQAVKDGDTSPETSAVAAVKLTNKALEAVRKIEEAQAQAKGRKQ